VISSKHLKEEIAGIEATFFSTTSTFEKATLKCMIIIIKLLANIRTNQALDLQEKKIEPITARTIRAED
jgi:hypothetical protein